MDAAAGTSTRTTAPEPARADRRPPAGATRAPAETGGQRAGWVVVLVALGLRLALLVALDSPGRGAREGPWDLGHEPLCMARAWLDGRGLADPWGHGTGLTGWLTPPYPLFLALFWWALGASGAVFAGAVFVLQAAASAVTCAVLLAAGRALDRPRAGLAAAWIWALHPVAAWNAVNQVWDSTFVALAIALFLWRASAAGPRATPERARRLGFGFGALLLLNPAALTVLPLALLHLVHGLRGRALVHVAASVLLPATVVCLPWALRNQLVIGAFGLRTNLGVELLVGNNEGAYGRPNMALHPSDSAVELARYRALGEAAYAREAKARALGWVRAHPLDFARLTARRAQLFWVGVDPPHDRRTDEGRTAARDPRSWVKWLAHASVGVAALLAAVALALWREGTRTWVWLGAALLFPAPYYLTHVHERYRLQIEPVLVLLAATGLVALAERVRARRPTTRDD